MNNSIFGKTIENARKHRHKTCNKQSNKELFIVRTILSYNKIFSENSLAIEMKKIQTFMNKPVYLVLSILELSKIVMYEFWYDYVKPKYRKKSKTMLHGYRQVDSPLKTGRIYLYISKDIKARIEIMNQAGQYRQEKNKKVVGLMKDELGEKIMKEFAGT